VEQDNKDYKSSREDIGTEEPCIEDTDKATVRVLETLGVYVTEEWVRNVSDNFIDHCEESKENIGHLIATAVETVVAESSVLTALRSLTDSDIVTMMRKESIAKVIHVVSNAMYLGYLQGHYRGEILLKESGHTKSGHTKSGHTESGHTESGHTKSGHTESGHTESGHTESGHTEPGQDESTQKESVQ